MTISVEKRELSIRTGQNEAVQGRQSSCKGHRARFLPAQAVQLRKSGPAGEGRLGTTVSGKEGEETVQFDQDKRCTEYDLQLWACKSGTNKDRPSAVDVSFLYYKQDCLLPRALAKEVL